MHENSEIETWMHDFVSDLIPSTSSPYNIDACEMLVIPITFLLHTSTLKFLYMDAGLLKV